MTAPSMLAPPGHVAAAGVREATDADNAALIELAAACPMVGDLAMRIDRAPDFFTLARLEGERWRVGVAESEGRVVGCVTGCERTAYVNGTPTRTGYAGDLKVHPAHRGGFAADALQEFAREVGREYGGDDLPTLVTVLGGNRSMERRAAGPRGLPTLTRFATLDVHAIPFLPPPSSLVAGFSVRPARDEDLEEMSTLWRRIAPTRQLAPVLSAEGLRAWLHDAPGLSVHDYLLACGPDGRIAGFVALWDQCAFKQLRVLGYSSRLALARRVLNALAPLTGMPRLPAAGEPLRSLAALHLCVPSHEPGALRALLRHALALHRSAGHLFLTLALDRRDPLRRALGGLFAQPTVVGAYATTPGGRWTGAPLDARPLHFESALV
jgi:hypothetical protein